MAYLFFCCSEEYDEEDVGETRIGMLLGQVVKVFRAFLSLVLTEPFAHGAASTDFDFVQPKSAKTGNATIQDSALVPAIISKTSIDFLGVAMRP